MVVPRAPRPPVLAPKRAEPPFDPNELERWIGRLSRAIRLKRLERRFLAPQRDTDPATDDKDLESRER
jgi:hypothetical protein